MRCVAEAFHAYRAELLRFAAGYASRQEAEDVVQEAYVRTLQRPAGLCDVGDRRAWLFRVVRNLLIDRARLAKDEVDVDAEALAAPASDLEAVDALAACLPRVLHELAPEDRAAIIACDLDGQSQQAFADASGMTLTAAKSRVLRARRRLRARLLASCNVRFDDTGNVCCFSRCSDCG